MAIPLEGCLECRRTAPFHIQLELENPHLVGRVAGDIEVQGRVIRMFRADGRLAMGDPVTFTLWACDKGDEPTGPAYVYFDDFTAAKFMEAYLYGDPPKCRLAAYEFSIVATPTEEPTLTVQQLEGLLRQFSDRPPVPPRVSNAAKWWQFWRR